MMVVMVVWRRMIVVGVDIFKAVRLLIVPVCLGGRDQSHPATCNHSLFGPEPAIHTVTYLQELKSICTFVRKTW